MREQNTSVQKNNASTSFAVIIFLLAVAGCCIWLAANLRLGSTAVSSTLENSKSFTLNDDITTLVSGSINRSFSGVSGFVEVRPSYSIPETALSAPQPDPAKFGSTTDPSVIRELIESASYLLEGDSFRFDPETVLFPGSEIRYYCDDSILAVVWKEEIDGMCCSCAEVKISDGSQIRRKIADDTYGSSIQYYASEMAAGVNAVLAINGDFYTYREQGITMYQRQLYRCVPSKVDSCYFTSDGDMVFVYAGEVSSPEEAQAIADKNDAVFSVAFGPVLVDNGEIVRVSSYPIGEIDKLYSRTGIGMFGTRHYFLMTINQEGDCAKRCRVEVLGQLMYNKGCQKAYTLDGGQTSVMIFNNTVFNRVDWGNERTMSDIIYFASAVPEAGG